MPSDARPAGVTFILQVLAVTANVEAQLAKAATGIGLNRAQLVLLLVLPESQPRSPSQLAAQLGHSRARVGMQLAALRKQGLCKTSKPLPGHDQRETYYTLTKVGRDRRNAAIRALDSLEFQIRGGPSVERWLRAAQTASL